MSSHFIGLVQELIGHSSLSFDKHVEDATCIFNGISMNFDDVVTELNLATAKQLIEAAEQTAAEDVGQPMVITVANSEGNLIAQHRMDDAWLASVSISRNKAYTAAALDMPTHDLAEASEPGNSLYGLQTTDDNNIVIFGGGYPLTRDGEVVGAIGASGGEVSQDREVAEAGVEKWDELVAGTDE